MKTILSGKLVLLLILLMLISCNRKTENFDKRLHGQDINLIIKKKGIPNYQKEFLLEPDSLQEYQYNLYNIFPNSKEKKVIIKELCWVEKNKKTVIWFYKENKIWKSIDNITWDIIEIKY